MTARYSLLLLAIAALSGCPAQPQPPVASPSPSPSPSAPATPAPSVSQAPAGAHNSEVSEQEACQYLQAGPTAALTASADESGAPEVKSDDRRYAVTLRAGEGGWVKFVSPKTAEWSFYTDREAFFLLQDAQGTTVAGARIPGSKFCAEVFAHRAYELAAGPYFLQLESATGGVVHLVVEETHPEGAGAGAH